MSKRIIVYTLHEGGIEAALNADFETFSEDERYLIITTTGETTVRIPHRIITKITTWEE